MSTREDQTTELPSHGRDYTDAEIDSLEALVKAQPGRCVFVKTDDTSVFRCGNIMQISDDGAYISFPRDGLGRREEPEYYHWSSILESDDIENNRLARSTLKADRRLVYESRRDLIRIVTLLSPWSYNDTTFTVTVLRHVDGEWLASNECIEVRNAQLSTALYYVAVLQRRWIHVVHPFIHAIEHEAGSGPPIAGEAEIHFGRLRTPINVRITVPKLVIAVEASVSPSIARELNALPSRWRVNRTISSVGEPVWTARHAFVGGATEGTANPSPLAVKMPSLSVQMATIETKITREIFKGVVIRASNCNIFEREPEIPPIPMLMGATYHRGIELKLLGRSALIYRPPVVGAESSDGTIGIMYVGSPYAPSQLKVITSLLSFIGGGRAAHALTETFDMERKTSMTLGQRIQPTDHLLPPVPIDDRLGAGAAIISHLPALAEKIEEVYRSDGADDLGAALHHYAEGVDSSYSTTRILRLSVAFEALVNLVTRNYDPDEQIIRDKKLAKRIRSALKAALKNEFEDEITGDEERRLCRKLDGVNSASNTERIAEFWRRSGVSHSSKDDELIRRLRNDSVHRGYVRVINSKRGTWQNYDDANRLINIFNRCLLTFLEYKGPVRVADSQRLVHARSGRAYKIAEQPAAGEIRITTLAPQTSAADAEIAERLRLLPRRVRKNRK